MSFDQVERSNYDGNPIELYEFILGSTSWRYTPVASPMANRPRYEPIAISRDGYSSSGNPDTDDLAIRISAKATVTDLFVGSPPSEKLQLIIRDAHPDTESVVVWSGIVKSGKRVSDAEFVFTCNSILSTLNRNGLRLFWSRTCPHALYDQGCRVNPNAFATALQINHLTGSSVRAPALATLPQGYLAGGFLSFTGRYGSVERRGIERHVNNAIHLLGNTEGLSVGDWITVYPGCDRVVATCDTKFNNLANYGGFPHLPTKSPFDGDPIF